MDGAGDMIHEPSASGCCSRADEQSAFLLPPVLPLAGGAYRSTGGPAAGVLRSLDGYKA